MKVTANITELQRANVHWKTKMSLYISKMKFHEAVYIRFIFLQIISKRFQYIVGNKPKNDVHRQYKNLAPN